MGKKKKNPAWDKTYSEEGTDRSCTQKRSLTDTGCLSKRKLTLGVIFCQLDWQTFLYLGHVSGEPPSYLPVCSNFYLWVLWRLVLSRGASFQWHLWSMIFQRAQRYLPTPLGMRSEDTGEKPADSSKLF